MKVLVLDVGGTSVKLLATGQEEPRHFASGPSLTPARLVTQVKRLTTDWPHHVVSIGYPGLVVHGRIVAEPWNLGRGWVGFAFRKAFRRPVRVMNDAAMQALGSYEGGRMLFLSLGTGLGSAMIVNGIVAPMELAHLPYRRGRTYEEYVGEAGRRRMGSTRWREHVRTVVGMLRAALEPDYVVLGGGNVARLRRLPAGVRRGSNANAFIGGFRLWDPAYVKR